MGDGEQVESRGLEPNPEPLECAGPPAQRPWAGLPGYVQGWKGDLLSQGPCKAGEGNLGMWLKEGSLSGSAVPPLEPAPQPQEGIYPVVLVAVKPGSDEDHQEKCLSQLYDHMPEGMTPLATLKNVHQRQRLGVCRLSCSLPPRAPSDTSTHQQLHAGPQGRARRVGLPESSWPLWIQKPGGIVLWPQRASRAVFSQVLRGTRAPTMEPGLWQSSNTLAGSRGWPLVVLIWKDAFLRPHLRTGNELS